MTRELITLVTQVSCNSITKKQNETLTVRVNYTYQGPAKKIRLFAVVTQETLVQEFDEIGSTSRDEFFDLPESLTPTTKYSYITGLPLSGCEAKSGYGIKVYALDIDGKPEWGCKRVLTIQSAVPSPELNVTSLYLS
jgi:hypothetical protein